MESSDDDESMEVETTDNHVIIDTVVVHTDHDYYVIDVDHEDYRDDYIIDDGYINDESLEPLDEEFHNHTPSLEAGGLETLQMFDATPEEVLRGITIPLTPNAPLRPIMTQPRMNLVNTPPRCMRT